jgi:hypothetical protein
MSFCRKANRDTPFIRGKVLSQGCRVRFGYQDGPSVVKHLAGNVCVRCEEKSVQGPIPLAGITAVSKIQMIRLLASVKSP